MKLGEIIENAAIIIAIFSLWPVILRWQHVGWKVFMYVMLAAMVWVFIRRVRRYSSATKEQRHSREKQHRM